MYYKVKYIDGTENDFGKECETINLEEKDFVVFCNMVLYALNTVFIIKEINHEMFH